MHSCSKSRIPRVWGSFPKKLTQVTLELYPTQSFRKQIGSFLEAVEEHFAALRHSSLDEETSITTNFFSKRQFLKLNTVGQVRKNAIMHISCHYLNSMKPVHLLTMREEPPGIVHCSLSLYDSTKENPEILGCFFPHCVVIIGWGMLSYHHFLFWKKKSMTRLYVWPKMYLYGPVDWSYTSSKKRSIKALQKQGGSMVPLGSVKIWNIKIFTKLENWIRLN